jgi:pimeloyl-ACP methyl ester carboxylesterase
MPYRSRMRSFKALLFVLSLLFCFNEADRLCAQSSTAGAINQIETAPNGTTISHHTTQVNGVQYHYALSGSGPTTIVLLHGWPVTWYHWHAIIPKLAERYTVVAPDLRGLGLTAKAKAGYDKRTVAGDIYELVRQLGHEHAYVVGHDIGGMVAFAMAHEYPAMVQKLVILDAPLPGLGIWEESQRRLWHLGFHQVPNLPEALVSGNVRTYLKYFFTFNVHNPAAIGEHELAEYVYAYSQPGALEAGFAYYRAFNDDIKANEIYARTKLRMPVLALGGELTTREGTLRQLQPIAENVRGGILEKSGHWFAAEQPDELVRRLLAFFAEP